MTKQQQAIGILSIFCVLTITIRLLVTKSTDYTFLLWNLFLAIIPYILSEWMRKTKLTKIKTMFLSSLWLLFLPNSPYIITDLIHLHKSTSTVIWLDLLMIFSFAFTGLSIAIISMYDMHKIIQKLWTNTLANCVIILITFLCGYGIYLGRFLRLNSWDIFTVPLQTFKKSILSFSNELAWLVTLGFGSLLWTLFFAYKTLNQSDIKK